MTPTRHANRMIIAAFWCGTADLALERTGRPGRAVLLRGAAADPVPVAELAFHPVTGVLVDHWQLAGAEGLDREVIAAWVAAALPHLAAWAEQTSTPAYERRQREALADLAEFHRPVPGAARALVDIEPAPDLRYRLTRIQVGDAIGRVQSGSLSAADLQLWARTFYQRCDAGAELEHHEVIGRVLAALAHPGTDARLSVDRPRGLLEALGLEPPRWFRRPAVAGGLTAVLATVVPLLVGVPPVPFPAIVGVAFGVAHAASFVADRARLGHDAALQRARRDALMSLPACLAVMATGAAW
ncbi:hypothetical protein [Glycomyces sp. MUSA5-2]|uniref:hypothetical protein n=1 Tax=Glycomyces sp. MUSA5-2 TaxID=2053002 RepID=UPI00300821F4